MQYWLFLLNYSTSDFNNTAPTSPLLNRTSCIQKADISEGKRGGRYKYPQGGEVSMDGEKWRGWHLNAGILQLKKQTSHFHGIKFKFIILRFSDCHSFLCPSHLINPNHVWHRPHALSLMPILSNHLSVFTTTISLLYAIPSRWIILHKTPILSSFKFLLKTHPATPRWYTRK